MTTQHTAGLWSTKVIDTIHEEPALWHIVQVRTGGVIAEVQSVNAADARLIAAAPDLLELARQIALAAEQNEGSIPTDIVSGAIAAIAKATGETA